MPAADRDTADHYHRGDCRRAGGVAQKVSRGRKDNVKLGPVAALKSRKAAANGAGLSPRQAKEMLRVANIPEDQFTDAIAPAAWRYSPRSAWPRRARVSLAGDRRPGSFS
jgi:hypothetical protein